ncbi:putative globular PEP-CTERM protein [Geminisphaera colitermitum]|uniref:putative globular PEP-CTERM protein n=1 Tax=Geminisphaera colitermitum TaxID=1148786 RepID=UPI000158CD31|nr:putative globular PEP-CTERM protein [Geminisphaera colitermitum]
MKKIIAISLALGLSAIAQAIPTISWLYQGGGTAVDGALATNGYIATHWGGTGPNDLTLLGVSAMLDAYGPEYAGQGWYDFQAEIESERNTQYYAATRVFQYQPGTFFGVGYDGIEGFDVDVYSVSLADLASFWTLIQGTDVMQAEVAGYFTTSPSGLGTPVGGYPNATWPLTLTLSGIPDTPASAVPEPSTYAALAGLAMLVFVMVRRRK